MIYVPDLSYLKVKSGDVIRSSWANELIDWIEHSLNDGAVTYDGYVQRSLIPVKDLALNLGTDSERFKEIHVGDVYATDVNADVGYFDENVYVQGKRVLKDEDPIYIASFFAYAVEQLRDVVLNALSEREIPPRPIRKAIVVGYNAPPLTDVFASDVLMDFDGRAKIKVIADSSVYVYAKFTPYGFTTPIVALLFDSTPIPPNTIKEDEMTVNAGDKVNVRVSGASKVTVVLYNIPSS